MDHEFRTRRVELDALNDAIDMLSDAVRFLSASPEDLALVRSRCDTEVADEGIRDVVTRRSTTVGRLTKEIDALLPDGSGLPVGSHDAWAAFVAGDDQVQDDKLKTHLRDLTRRLIEQRSLILPEEVDEGSSSYSDYTASNTETSDDDDDDDEEDDEEDDDVNKSMTT